MRRLLFCAVLLLALFAPGRTLEDTRQVAHSLDDYGFRSNVEQSIVIIQTVKLAADDQRNLEISMHKGSGIVVGPRLILTARHVLEGISMPPIVVFRGVSYTSEKTKQLENTDAGFILLGSPIEGAKPIEWNMDPSTADVRAYAFGAWGGLDEITYTAGTLHREGKHIEFNGRELDWVMTGSPMLFFGFSGGALVDADGRLLGVNFGANTEVGTFFVDARPLRSVALDPGAIFK